MKKTTLTFITSMLLSSMMFAQSLSSIDPSSGNSGDILDVTISGIGTHFAQSSNTIWLEDGSGNSLYAQSSDASSNTEKEATFCLKYNLPTGNYNLLVYNYYDGFMQLNNAFTITTDPTPPSLTDINPNEGEQGETLDVTITGLNTHFLQSTTTIWMLNGPKSYIYPINTEPINDNELQATFKFYNTQGIGAYDINTFNEADGYLEMPDAFTITPNPNPTSIASIDPNEGHVGEYLGVTITGENTNFAQSSTTIWFDQASKTAIYPEFTTVISDNQIFAFFMFLNTYTTGQYNVKAFNDIDGMIVEYGGFDLTPNPTPPQIDYLSPSTGNQGETLTVEISGLNTNFTHSSNTIWFSHASSTAFYANEVNVISDYLLEALFSIPLNAIPANFDLNLHNIFDGQVFLPECFYVADPPAIINDTTLNIDENSPEGTVVGTIYAINPDGDELTFSITPDTPNAAFDIDNNGVIFVNNPDLLDYETTPVFQCQVQAFDNTSYSNLANVTIDLNDKPDYIEENNLDGILFPNPIVENNIIIDSKLLNSKLTRVRIFNQLGNQVFIQEGFESPEIDISANSLSVGVYIIELKTEKETISRKFIKK